MSRWTKFRKVLWTHDIYKGFFYFLSSVPFLFQVLTLVKFYCKCIYGTDDYGFYRSLMVGLTIRNCVVPYHSKHSTENISRKTQRELRTKLTSVSSVKKTWDHSPFSLLASCWPYFSSISTIWWTVIWLFVLIRLCCCFFVLWLKVSTLFVPCTVI